MLGRAALLWKPLGMASLAIHLGEALAGLDQLDHVDELLERHDGSADAGENPGNGRVLQRVAESAASHTTGLRLPEGKDTVGDDVPSCSHAPAQGLRRCRGCCTPAG